MQGRSTDVNDTKRIDYHLPSTISSPNHATTPCSPGLLRFAACCWLVQ